MITVLEGDARTHLSRIEAGSVDCVITDPIWPNVPDEMFPGCGDPHKLLRETLEALPDGVKRLVISMRNDCDPRFLTAVPEKWPFFHATWMYYALPGAYGRKMGGNEVAYCFGEPIRFAKGQQLIPGMCKVPAQPLRQEYKMGHPCPRAQEHMDWLVKWWSEPGETILDPFAGTGTIGVAADRQGRDAILIEINAEYATMARNRIAQDAPLFAEVA